MRTSPNERCRCGSGKKYKRCCQAADGVARAAPRGPVGSSARELLEREGGMRQLLERSMRRLEQLLAGPGSLVEIRFDATLFAQVVAKRQLRLARREQRSLSSDALFERLYEESAPALVTPAFLKRLRSRLESALDAGALDAEGHESVAMALATLERVGDDPAQAIALCPVPLLVFRIQYGEWLEAERSLADLVDGAVADLRAGKIDFKDVDRRILEAGPELAPILENVQREIGERLERSIDHALRLLSGPKPPTLFRYDELLWLSLELLLLQRQEPAVRQEAFVVLDQRVKSELGEAVTRRLFEAGLEPGLSKKRRRELTVLVEAFGSAPLRLVGPVTKNPVLAFRPGEQQAIQTIEAESSAQEESFRRYAEWLASTGEQVSAARILRALELAGPFPNPVGSSPTGPGIPGTSAEPDEA